MFLRCACQVQCPLVQLKHISHCVLVAGTPETALAVVGAFQPNAGALVLEEEIREAVIGTAGTALGGIWEVPLLFGLLTRSPVILCVQHVQSGSSRELLERLNASREAMLSHIDALIYQYFCLC